MRQEGNAYMRIYHEILRGITESPTDTEEERAYRAEVVAQVEKIRADGGVPEFIHDD